VDIDMGRKGRLELRQPQSRAAASAARGAPWRDAAARLLAAKWDPAETWRQATERRTYVELAGVVLEMFDAGARDAEVAAFLRAEEVAAAGAPCHTDAARGALAAEIHRAAASTDRPGAST
jgi:hypothetical protein